jgi:hypothetical protein
MPGAEGSFKKGTNIVVRQGQTTSAANGQDVDVQAKGSEGQQAKDLKI